MLAKVLAFTVAPGPNPPGGHGDSHVVVKPVVPQNIGDECRALADRSVHVIILV
jgi:hypothetical protein